MWRGNFYLVFILKNSYDFLKDDGRCPGAFHVGCDLSTSTTTTTTTEVPATTNKATIVDVKVLTFLFVALLYLRI